MKNIQRVTLSAVAGFLLLGTAACGGGYDRQETLDQFEADLGLTEEQAVCMVDKMEAEIGTDRLGENVFGDAEAALTPEETAVMEAAVTDCLFADLGGLEEEVTTETEAEG